MSRRLTARDIAEKTTLQNLNKEQVAGLVEAALKRRDERAARIVENADLDCLIPSEVAGKIRKDDEDAF